MQAQPKRLTAPAEAAHTGSTATGTINSSNSRTALHTQGCNIIKSGGRFTVVGKCLRFFISLIKVTPNFLCRPIAAANTCLPLTVTCASLRPVVSTTGLFLWAMGQTAYLCALCLYCLPAVAYRAMRWLLTTVFFHSKHTPL